MTESVDLDPFAVKALQALDALGKDFDGDPERYSAAVIRFQKAADITPDGVVGPQTTDALEAAIGGEAGASSPPAEADAPEPEQRDSGTAFELPPKGISELAGLGMSYGARIAESAAGSVDSRHVFAGLMLASDRSGRSGLTGALLERLAPLGGESTNEVEFLVASLGSSVLPESPGEFPPPPPWADDGSRLIADAREIARRVTGIDAVAARHLVGAMFARVGSVWEWLESLDVDPRPLRALAFRSQIEFPVVRDDLGAWAELLSEPGGQAPISGYVSDHVTFGDEALKDRLGVDGEVKALSSVIMAQQVHPPMSIGLFGDWGTGKSYFMSLMHAGIDDIAKRAKRANADGEETAFCSEVVQIDFNAWHFVDTNLWASIVTRILSELARQLGGDPDEDKDAYDTAFDQLIDGTRRANEQLRDAQDSDSDANDRVEELEGRLATLTATIAEKEARAPTISTLSRAVLANPEVGSSVQSASATLGLDEVPETASELWRALADARSLAGRARALYRWVTGPPDTRPSVRAARAVGVLLLVALSIGIPLVVTWLITRDVGGSAQAVAGAIVFATTVLANALTWLRKGIRVVDESVGELESARDQLVLQMTEEQRRQREQVQVELAATRTQQQETARRLVTARDELAQAQAAEKSFNRDQFVFEWILDRSTRSEYGDQLGIISFIRDDFEQLSKLLGESDGDERDLNPMKGRAERIVLYIDDLDRCPAERVVEVLQAVHLLLAFPLFVVVVGVDSRWLLHALEERYSAFGVSDDGEADDDADDAHWQTTPQNYLEKIFQIPFTLRPMGQIGFSNIVNDLTQAQVELPVAAEGAETSGSTPAGSVGSFVSDALGSSAGALAPATGRVAAASASAVSSIASGGSTQSSTEETGEPAIDPAPAHLVIGPNEIRFLKHLSELVPTPRATKRLVNTYRLIKATLPPADLARVEGGEYRPVLLMLAMQAGYPDEAFEVFRALGARQRGSWWTFVDQWTPQKRRGASGGYHNKLGVEMSDSVAGRWRRLHDAMARQRGVAPDDDIVVFRAHAQRVARFGFVTGRAVIARES